MKTETRRERHVQAAEDDLGCQKLEKARKGPPLENSGEAWPADTLLLDCKPPGLREMKFLLFEAIDFAVPSVMAALRHQQQTRSSPSSQSSLTASSLKSATSINLTQLEFMAIFNIQKKV